MTGVGRSRNAPPPTGLLDWRDSSHWSQQEKPCRYCGRPTNLRDSKRSPAHKTCAEQALQQQATEAADAYELGWTPAPPSGAAGPSPAPDDDPHHRTREAANALGPSR